MTEQINIIIIIFDLTSQLLNHLHHLPLPLRLLHHDGQPTARQRDGDGQHQERTDRKLEPPAKEYRNGEPDEHHEKCHAETRQCNQHRPALVPIEVEPLGIVPTTTAVLRPPTCDHKAIQSVLQVLVLPLPSEHRPQKTDAAAHEWKKRKIILALRQAGDKESQYGEISRRRNRRPNGSPNAEKQKYAQGKSIVVGNAHETTGESPAADPEIRRRLLFRVVGSPWLSGWAFGPT